MSSEFLAKVAEAAKRPRLPSHLFSKEKFCLIRKGLKPVERCSYEEQSGDGRLIGGTENERAETREHREGKDRNKRS